MCFYRILNVKTKNVFININYDQIYAFNENKLISLIYKKFIINIFSYTYKLITSKQALAGLLETSKNILILFYNVIIEV